MSPRVRIGNQTAVASTDRMEPFEFALAHGFDAFEWFADKKSRPDGSTAGWDEPDMDGLARSWIRDTGKAHGMFFSVHAPWQANPLQPGGVDGLYRSLDFAKDIGAELVNLHLYMDKGPAGYVLALEPVVRRAAGMGLRLSVENTPQTTPGDFNRTFSCFSELAVADGRVGMCLDIGHANLCAETHNDFVRYLDALGPQVPLVHMHVHENYGDSDSHLTLFTGPSRQDDSGVRALLARLCRRGFGGAMILEQWPQPPQLLVDAATRLRSLLNSVAAEGAADARR